MTVQEIIDNCQVDGLVVKLPPGQLDRKLYEQVAKTLQGIGGAWKGGKIAGFVFKTDPTTLLQRLQSGERINLKKDFQFFETPDELADMMALRLMATPKHSILEPSAGQGALIKAVLRRVPEAQITAYELMPENLMVLARADFSSQVFLAGEDFLKTTVSNFYHRIIANPPFSNNQDIEHIYRMFEILRPGGRMVTLSSNHWRISGNGKEARFRAFLEFHNAYVEDIPAGTFSKSGTQVATCMITIQKPHESVYNNSTAELEDRILNK